MIRSTRWLCCFAAVLSLSACGGSSGSSTSAAKSTSLSAASHGGMGAVPYNGGTTFRVWAPGADQVWVAGEFNGWQPTEMGNEFNGNFSIDVSGAHAGQQYKFQIRRGANTFWRIDPRAQQMVNSASNAIIHDRSSYGWQHDLDFKMPAYNEQVIYELHLGSFNSPGNGSLGNWNSAASKLDYLQWLGINVIEVMPAAEFPGSASWGYNPSNPFAPASAYGRPDDMKSFIDQAHAHGIAVVLDTVYNHFGPSDLPLWQFDGQSFGNNGGGIYFYNDWRANTPWGATRPDYGRAEVRDYIRDNALQWINEYHLDGLRLDAPQYMYESDVNGGAIPDGWNMLKEISDAVHQNAPWKLMIAEDMQNNSSVTQPTSNGGAGFNLQWEPDFVHPVQQVLETMNDQDRDMGAIAWALRHNYNGDAMQRVIYTESHDEVSNGKQRIPTAIGGWDSGGYFASKRSTLGAAMLMTSPGRPMLFEGQEFLTPGYFQAEVPLDWSNADRYHGIVTMYQDLIHLRRNWNNTTAGLRGGNINVFHVNNAGKVVGYHRWDQGGPRDDVVILANFSNQTFSSYNFGLPRGGLWKLRFNSDWSGYSSLFPNTNTFDVGAQGGSMDGMPYHGNLNQLGPYSLVILSQDM